MLGFVSYIDWWIQIFFLFARPFILAHKTGYLKIRKEVNGKDVYSPWRKYSYYSYYPLHLLMLYLVKVFS